VILNVFSFDDNHRDSENDLRHEGGNNLLDFSTLYYNSIYQSPSL